MISSNFDEELARFAMATGLTLRELGEAVRSLRDAVDRVGHRHRQRQFEELLQEFRLGCEEHRRSVQEKVRAACARRDGYSFRLAPPPYASLAEPYRSAPPRERRPIRSRPGAGSLRR